MRLHFYQKASSLHVEQEEGSRTETPDVVEGLNVEINATGEVVGLDFDFA